mmetsp:Transcript_20443/g.44133  ORF Transcript_20443/g.44133 Transcript_20443/m.44133 type:complete len:243 (+) Transcript_20443:81-809(+)
MSLVVDLEDEVEFFGTTIRSIPFRSNPKVAIIIKGDTFRIDIDSFVGVDHSTKFVGAKSIGYVVVNIEVGKDIVLVNNTSGLLNNVRVVLGTDLEETTLSVVTIFDGVQIVTFSRRESRHGTPRNCHSTSTPFRHESGVGWFVKSILVDGESGANLVVTTINFAGSNHQATRRDRQGTFGPYTSGESLNILRLLDIRNVIDEDEIGSLAVNEGKFLSSKRTNANIFRLGSLVSRTAFRVMTE